MTASREDIVAKAREWASYGDEDLALARHGLTMEENAPYRLVAYHAQQCAEKYLKAYLVLREVDFPFTHNLSLLLELCGEDETWVGSAEEAEQLTRYAVTTRYPGESMTISAEKAQGAVEVAARVRRTVREALAAEGLMQ